jgi:hypothetical protein
MLVLYGAGGSPLRSKSSLVIGVVDNDGTSLNLQRALPESLIARLGGSGNYYEQEYKN